LVWRLQRIILTLNLKTPCFGK